MSHARPSRINRSSIARVPMHIMSVIVYIVPAILAFIPYVGYFAWLLPLGVFMFEKSSHFVRYNAAMSFCIAVIRLVIDVMFDSIAGIALESVSTYALTPAFTQFWGNVANPGLSAMVVKYIFAALLCVVCAICSWLAVNKKIWRIPLLCDVTEYMLKDIRPLTLYVRDNDERN